MFKARCECGGRLKAATLGRFDLHGETGVRVELERVPGRRCSGCGEESLDAWLFEEALRYLAAELLSLPARLDGAAARFLRLCLGLPQGKLATRMGLRRQTVCEWENDVLPISSANDFILRTLVGNHLSDLGRAGGERIKPPERVRTGPVDAAALAAVGPKLSRIVRASRRGRRAAIPSPEAPRQVAGNAHQQTAPAEPA